MDRWTFDAMTPAQRLSFVRGMFVGKGDAPCDGRVAGLDATDLALFFELAPTPPSEKDAWLDEFRSRLHGARGRTPAR